MAASLLALRASRTLPPGFFIFKDSWYSNLLEAESNPGSGCGRKDYVNLKNPPRRYLQHSVLTTTLPRAPMHTWFLLIQYQVHLVFHGLGLLLPVFCIV
jgi:hypothetical protein